MGGNSTEYNKEYFKQNKEKQHFCDCCQKYMSYWSKSNHMKSKKHSLNMKFQHLTDDKRERAMEYESVMTKLQKDFPDFVSLGATN